MNTAELISTNDHRPYAGVAVSGFIACPPDDVHARRAIHDDDRRDASADKVPAADMAGIPAHGLDVPAPEKIRPRREIQSASCHSAFARRAASLPDSRSCPARIAHATQEIKHR